MTGKKKAVITNFILIAVFFAVFAASFFPRSDAPVYGGSEQGAIYNGNINERNVSLMFNVYENTETVEAILDLLNSRGAKATFFVGGCWADDNAETLKRIVGEGHELANHGYFHKDHAKLSYEKNKEEIELADKIIYALCGTKSYLFAPPSGSFSENTLRAAFDLGYKVIMWSKDTIDWRDKDKSKVYSRATADAKNGDFILMHPKKHTLSVLPQILDFYEKSGFKVVTVSENLAESAD